MIEFAKILCLGLVLAAIPMAGLIVMKFQHWWQLARLFPSRDLEVMQSFRKCGCLIRWSFIGEGVKVDLGEEGVRLSLPDSPKVFTSGIVIPWSRVAALRRERVREPKNIRQEVEVLILELTGPALMLTFYHHHEPQAFLKTAEICWRLHRQNQLRGAADSYPS